MGINIKPSASVHTRTIYVTLDSLLDTRASVLESHWPGVLAPLLQSGEYHNRSFDSFGPVSFEEFKARYEARTAEDLRYAVVTPILNEIRENVLTFQFELINENFRSTPRVLINTYPYVCSQEWGESLAALVSNLITAPGLVDVQVFSAGPDEANTTWMNTNVNIIYDYDGMDWMESQTQHFEQRTIAQVMLFVPSLDKTGKLTHEQMVELGKETGIHPLVDLENLATPMVTLKFRPVSLFSVVDPRLQARV